MALQEDNDTTGDIISIDGAATTVIVSPEDAKEDRGDDFTPTADPLAPAAPPATAAAAPAPEPAGDQRPHTIPKVRFDEVITERNSLKEQLIEANRVIEQARATSAAPAVPPAPAAPEFDENAKEKEYASALIDGDTDLAATIRMSINAHIRQQATADAETRVESRQSQRSAAGELQTAANDMVAQYPYLDEEGGEDALAAIVALRDAKFAAGNVSMGQALRQAAAILGPRFRPDGDAPRDAPAPAGDPRTAAALARGAAHSTLQPPALGGTGARAAVGRVDVANMTDDQFENLAPAEKKRLRGDQ